VALVPRHLPTHESEIDSSSLYPIPVGLERCCLRHVDFVNEPGLRYLGCSWEELSAEGGLGPGHQTMSTESVPEMERDSKQRGPPHHNDHDERPNAPSDGQYRWLLTRARPLSTTGRKTSSNWYGTATDIEDRKRRGRAGLRAQASLLNIRTTNFVALHGRGLTYWNHGGEQLFDTGWTSDTAVGRASQCRRQFVRRRLIRSTRLLATGRWERRSPYIQSETGRKLWLSGAGRCNETSGAPASS